MNQKNNNKKASKATILRGEKRERLRESRKNEFLKNTWRTSFFFTISFLLGYANINYGWRTINPDEIEIKGNQQLKANTIRKESGINNKIPILAINPKAIEKNLLESLPIKKAVVRRLLLPKSIEIEIKEREPVAYAFRRSLNGKEKGVIDDTAYWIPIGIASKARLPKLDLEVEGWMESHRLIISKVMQNKNLLGSHLKKIIFNQNGELVIETELFKKIKLGNNSDYLASQLTVISHLTKVLPDNFRSNKNTIIDIRDPSKPEIQIKTDKK